MNAEDEHDNVKGFTQGPFLALLQGADWVKPSLTMVRLEGGYGLQLEVQHKVPCWLLAEKSGKVRIFRRADTALELCLRWGVTTVPVKLGSRKMASGASSSNVMSAP